jgi:hypothetical protein
MSEHTPGPWRVAFGNRLEIHGPKDEIGWPKSIVYNAGLCTDKEAQANARLIAAAPQLLQALNDLVVWVEHLPGGRSGWEYVNALAAIASVTKE